MVSPPPSYTSAASVSRSKTSRDDIQSMADKMLRASLSRKTSDASPSSAGQASRDNTSVADKMLRASLSRNVSSSSASVSRSQVKDSGDGMRSFADEMLRNSLSRNASASSSQMSIPKVARARPPIIGSSPEPRIGIHGPTKPDSLAKGKGESWTPGISAAEKKSKLQQLQQNSALANARSPQRSTTGVFKEACSTDLLFLIDTTSSMGSYINAAKEQVKSIVSDIKTAFLSQSQVRVAIVGYKDHRDRPNVQFLDFTPLTDPVHQFLRTLNATGGADLPEDVLGGVQQAINASWQQQTRCIIHIADAPGHTHVLHDLSASSDNYYKLGSEPHGLSYEPLLNRLVQLNVNYALLRINSTTDRMALAFSRVYADASADVKLLPSNIYHSESPEPRRELSNKRSINFSTNSQFEEMELGTTYSALRHLVVNTVTASVTRMANSVTTALSRPSKPSKSSNAGTRGAATNLAIIEEDEGSGISASYSSKSSSLAGVGISPITSASVSGTASATDLSLETVPPQWDKPRWLDETREVEGFCPDVLVHSASTLNDMMAADENIKLGVVQLTIHSRSRPFAQGSLRAASYARTAASTSQFVVKSFIEDDKGLADVTEDMRIQAMCKSFALEFNSLLKTEHPIDFIVTTCLQTKPKSGTRNNPGDSCLSLEPFIEGEYVKYNSNGLWVQEDSPDDPVNQTAQAFSHFTFERSWGLFLVNDLQGVGHLLTDPAIQTRDHERFKLNPTNLNEDGFKFFFAVHECNSICRKLELKSNKEMVISGKYEFRDEWPTMDPTVCCSNKLCRRILLLSSSHESDIFRGYHWCDTCWPQLQSSMVRWICVAPGPNHEFDVSRFFYESQGQVMPRKCSEHLEKDTTMSSAAAVGGSLYSKMKSSDKSSTISGRVW